jgi:hypothetical protein
LCEPAEIEYFTQNPIFLRLILHGGGGSTADLLGAAIRKASNARAPEFQREFLVAAGRQLAGMLSHDLTMLQQVLSMIRPD